MSDRSLNLDSLFEAAVEIESTAERAEFLNRSCGDDAKLRHQLEQLLQSHDKAGSFLDNPPAGLDVTVVPGGFQEAAASAPQSAHGAPSDDHQSVSVGRASFSVLRSLNQPMHVVLRDAANGDDPIVRPTSSEVPDHDPSSRYRLDGEIARGGMGAILKGRDTDLGRDLAIKVLLDEHRTKPEVIQRFVEEAQIGGQLQHPGIAPVYELGQFGDQRPFFSMKLVKGETLSKRLADRHNPVTDRAKLLGVFEQICQTMAYAHSRGVIHRDLKPANIMVGAFGEVQVMDWGLAKVLSLGGVADEKRARSKQPGTSIIQTLRSMGGDTPQSFGSAGSETQMGSVMGTPAYMPPEQALGEIDQLDQRADVFGLGAILCEILTGLPPYVSDDATQIYRMASRGKLSDCFTRLEQCGADVELIALTKDCLQAEPMDRPQDAGALAERITGYLESVETKLRETEVARATQAARAEEERKRHRVSVALAVSVILTLCLGGGGWAWMRQQAQERRDVATSKVNAALSEARLHQGLSRQAVSAVAPGPLVDLADLQAQLRELEKAVAICKQAAALTIEESVDAGLRDATTRLLADLQESAVTVRQQVDQVREDLAFQKELEEIRLRQADGNLKFDMDTADSLYRRAFRERNLDVLALNPEESARRIRGSAIRESLIAALDNWARASDANTDENFSSHAAVNRWSTAYRFGRILTEDFPENSYVWLRLAPVIVLASDEAAYTDFCNRMIQQFGETQDAAAAEHACKACLLLPGHIELQQLPGEIFEKSVDEGLTPDHLRGWWWGTRALLALRRGNLQAAVQYVENSESFHPRELTSALNMAVAAMAHHHLQQVAEARTALVKTAGLVNHLHQISDNRGHHDLLIAQLLLREAQTLIDGQPTAALVAQLEEASVHESVASLSPREILLTVANAADSSPWRSELRKALSEADQTRLSALADGQEVQSQSPELIAWLGAALRQSGVRDAAARVLRAAQMRRPGDFWLNYELGATLDNTEHDAEGIGFVRAACAVRPDSSGALWHLALRLRDIGQLDESVRVFRHIAQLRPEDYWVRVNLGHVLQLRKNLEEAAAEFRTAVQLERKPIYAHVSLGNIFRDQGKVNEAIAEHRKALEHDPNCVQAHLHLGHALLQQGKLDQSMAEYKTVIRLDPKAAYPHVNLGIILMEQEKVFESIAEFRRAIELNPQLSMAHLNLGRALRLNGELDEGIAEYRIAIELDQENAMAHNNLGAALLMQNKVEEAMVEFQTALELDPDFTLARNNLCMALRQLGKVEQMIAILRTTIERDPQDAEAHNQIAWTYVSLPDSEGQFPHAHEAVTLAQRAVSLEPQSAVMLNTLGVAYYRVDQWEQAITTLEQSTALKDGDIPFNWLFLAMAHRQLNDQTQARFWYDKSLDWLKTHKSNVELQGFFDEAARLIDPSAADSAPPKDS